MKVQSLLAQALAVRDRWISAERGRFALFLPVWMAAGVIVYFAQITEPLLWPGACLAVGALAGAVVLRRRALGGGALLCVGCAALGFSSAGLAARRAAPWADVPRTAVVLRGVVARVEILPAGRRVTVVTPSLDGGAALPRAMRVRLRASDPVVVGAGDTVAVRALMRLPAAPAYPGGWDMQRDAYFGGMAAFGFAIGPASRVQVAQGGTLQALREGVAARVMAGLPGARGAIAATLLTGIGTAIPPADRAAFQASGLAHLLAVAGLHIGIVMGLVFAAVRRGLGAMEFTALRWPARQIAAVAALAAGGAYLVLTGAHVPILRSFAMASLVTLAVLTGRRAISMRALALAAAVIMLTAPYEVMGVSFQMSFAAVLALVAGWEAMRPRLRLLGLGRWWRGAAVYGGGLAGTSALAGTATLPFAAYHFGNAMLWYVPANMVAVPLTALWVMPWGVAALLLMPVGLQRLALVPMGWGVSGLLAVAHGVAGWPSAVMPVRQFPAGALLVMASGLVWLCVWRSRLRRAGVVVMLAGLGLAWLAASPDVLVSGDGHVVAARLGGVVFQAEGKGEPGFAREAAARVWGGDAAAAFPYTGNAAGDRVRCVAGQCVLDFGAHRVLLADAAPASCGGMDVVVARQSVGGICRAPIVVDPDFVASRGAASLTFGSGGAHVLTDREVRGDRPWVLLGTMRGAAGRGAARLPMAQSE